MGHVSNWQYHSLIVSTPGSRDRLLCCHFFPPSLLHVLGAFSSFYMGDLAYNIVIKSTNMFPLYLHSGIPRLFLSRFVSILTHNCFNVYVYQRCPLTLAAICRKWVFEVFFMTVATRENISGFYLIGSVNAHMAVQYYPHVSARTHTHRHPNTMCQVLGYLTAKSR